MVVVIVVVDVIDVVDVVDFVNVIDVVDVVKCHYDLGKKTRLLREAISSTDFKKLHEV